MRRGAEGLEVARDAKEDGGRSEESVAVSAVGEVEDEAAAVVVVVKCSVGAIAVAGLVAVVVLLAVVAVVGGGCAGVEREARSVIPPRKDELAPEEEGEALEWLKRVVGR